MTPCDLGKEDLTSSLNYDLVHMKAALEVELAEYMSWDMGNFYWVLHVSVQELGTLGWWITPE